MATAQIVQGEALTYAASGKYILNNPVLQAPKNLAQTVIDYGNSNIRGLDILPVTAVAASSSGANYFTVPNYVVEQGGAATYKSGIVTVYDGINVTSTGTITGVGILFPVGAPGQVFKLLFDVAVTTLTLVAPAGYSIKNPATSATANSVQNYCLIGNVWKNC